MKRITLMLLSGVCMQVFAQGYTTPAIPRDEGIEAKVEKTLSKMTLDEKVGQMLELNLDLIGTMTAENPQLDREKVKKTLRQFGSPESEVNKLLQKSDKEILSLLASYNLDIYKDGTKR